MYEIYCKLRDDMGVKDSDVAKATGVTKSTFSDWKSGRSNPKDEKLKKIADYFGVTTDYLRTGKNKSQNKSHEITPKDERDITKDLNNIMRKIESGEDGPLRYNGEEIDSESLALLKDAIDMSLRHLKIINKEKYNPNKNKE